VGFGLVKNTSGVLSSFYEPLGYEGYNYGAIIALNYNGIGLPVYLYNQVINLLYKTNSQIASALSCSPSAN